MRSGELPPLTHAGAFTRHGGFRLKACVDPDTDRRHQFALHWGVETEVADFDTLVGELGRYDVISICSPTDLHHLHLEQALCLQPRIIFCEKPLTSSESDSTRLVEACRAQGVALMVNYTRRWDPAVDELCRELKDGRWGVVRSVVAHYNKGILNNGGHMIDLLLRVMGPLELVCTAAARFDFWDADPTVAALLISTSTGVPVTLNPADARDYAYFELEIVCAHGVIRMQSGGLTWQIREVVPSAQFSGYQVLGAAVERSGRYEEAMLRAVTDIHAHLSDGAAVISTGEEALRVQRLCLQILQSATGEVNGKHSPQGNV